MSIGVINKVFAARIEPASHKLVLLAMASFADHAGGSVYPAVRRLAAMASLSHSNTQRCLRALQRMGLVSVIGHGQGGAPWQTTRYRLNLDRIAALSPTGGADATGCVDETGSVGATHGAQTEDHGVACRLERGGAGEAQFVREEPLKINHPAAAAPVGFEKFWSAYPKKLNKPAAIEAFRRLNPDADMLEAITTAVVRHREQPNWRKDGGRYIPQACNYLTDRRWEEGSSSEDSFSIKPWYETKSGILKTAKDTGISFDDSMQSGIEWLRFVARVWLAVGDGPHWDEDSPAYSFALELRNKAAKVIQDAIVSSAMGSRRSVSQVGAKRL